jgi:hypothetical protein
MQPNTDIRQKKMANKYLTREVTKQMMRFNLFCSPKFKRLKVLLPNLIELGLRGNG